MNMQWHGGSWLACAFPGAQAETTWRRDVGVSLQLGENPGNLVVETGLTRFVDGKVPPEVAVSTRNVPLVVGPGIPELAAVFS